MNEYHILPLTNCNKFSEIMLNCKYLQESFVHERHPLKGRIGLLLYIILLYHGLVFSL